MNMIPWRNKGKDRTAEPTEALTPFGGEIDRMVERFLGDPWNGWPLEPSAGAVEAGGFPLALDVTDTDEEVLVRAELPGMDAKDIDLSVSGDVLTITGEKASRTEQRKENVFHSERRFGAFHRSVRLPCRVEAGKVTASYEAGVLTVHLPRSEDARPRRIEVQTGR